MHVADNFASFADIDLTGRSAVMCDLDGCLLSGGHVYEGAGEFVRACGERLWVVSNNSSDTAATLAARLTGLGLPVPADRILLAGEQTVRRLAGDSRKRSVAVFADAPLRELAQELGLAPDEAVPEVVVLGRDGRFGLKALEQLAGLVVDGAELWATNLDLSHPAASGHPVPETGALLRALEACCGPLTVRSIGKPAPDLIEIALSRSGADRSRALFVGDNAATDGGAALAAGIPFARIKHPVRHAPAAEAADDAAAADNRRRAAC